MFPFLMSKIASIFLLSKSECMDSLNVVEDASLMWSLTIKVLDILEVLISTNIWSISFLLYLWWQEVQIGRCVFGGCLQENFTSVAMQKLWSLLMSYAVSICAAHDFLNIHMSGWKDRILDPICSICNCRVDGWIRKTTKLFCSVSVH